jgi:hypothetical protein
VERERGGGFQDDYETVRMEAEVQYQQKSTTMLVDVHVHCPRQNGNTSYKNEMYLKEKRVSIDHDGLIHVFRHLHPP